MKKLHNFCSGYTLIELLIAVSLSLLLLLGVTEMFRHVGSTMSDIQKSLNMSANTNAAAMQLRSDLEKINSALAHKPYDMVNGNPITDDGYLEIVEGMNACYRVAALSATYSGVVPPSSDDSAGSQSRSHVGSEHFPMWWVAQNPDTGASDLPDLTVGDVDDILAFTIESDPAYPLRGFINGAMNTSGHAEIVWFLRGTNLYRRILLLDDYNPNLDRATQDQIQQLFYARNDLSVRLDGTTIKANSMQDLVRREYRFAHRNLPQFPFHIGNQGEAWYYLRMPTLEEMVHPNWPGIGLLYDIGTYANLKYGTNTVTQVTASNYYDFWENPNALYSDTASIWQQDSKSGSIDSLVATPRHPRAGEDIVLKNV
ncbi:MAG: prepilin-type N-terminal cleavage/methylation domain-containing protein, partial [Planctomycetaceae bacterium]|nr:prepilin-type N-terminal cleavage/methylation domain-containing protein [Planctomycetaceae bacterium]